MEKFNFRELLFLGLANHLPRWKRVDKYKYLIYRLAGMNVDGRCVLRGPFSVRPFGGLRNIQVGKDAFLNAEIRFGARSLIRIGRNAQVGPRVMFETVSHGLFYLPGQGRGSSSQPIVVEEEAWIGAGVILTQGVTVGRGAVVAAGAVVTKDVEPMTVVGGVPAKLIRHLGEGDDNKS